MLSLSCCAPFSNLHSTEKPRCYWQKELNFSVITMASKRPNKELGTRKDWKRKVKFITTACNFLLNFLSSLKPIFLIFHFNYFLFISPFPFVSWMQRVFHLYSSEKCRWKQRCKNWQQTEIVYQIDRYIF